MRDQKGRNLLDFPDSYTVIDVETTGLDPRRDSLIEVAALKIRDNEIASSYSSLINPGFPISSFTSEFTGITSEQLTSASKPPDVLRELYDFIGDDVLVGHNVNFDINFLYDNFEKYLGEVCSNNFIDTLRLSKKYYKNLQSYKLDSLAKDLGIKVTTHHRSLADCETAFQLYCKLEVVSQNLTDSESELLESLSFDHTNPFYMKRIAVKGIPQQYSYTFMKAVSEKCNAELSDTFYRNCDYIIFSRYTYQRYKKGEYSEKFIKADRLKNAGTLAVLSEEEWCKMLNLPIMSRASGSSSKDISTEKTDFDETHPLFGKLCVFTGTLDKMQRKDAMQIVVDYGGQIGNSVTKKTNYLILGNNDYCPLIKDGKSTKQKKAEALKLAGNDIEIISEDVFYDMISEM